MAILGLVDDLPEHLFANPVWHALQTGHRQFAVSAGDALRYPADIAPFAAVRSVTSAAMRQLLSLLAPGEAVWLFGERHGAVPGLAFDCSIDCLQMILPADIEPGTPTHSIAALSKDDAAEMVALTKLAFPGFFRERTCELGSYYGVRADGQLIAMGGERLMLDRYAEISGVCTHPAHRGQGLGASIIRQIVSDHRRKGLRSWLHVGIENERAIQLYIRLGFRRSRMARLNRISRSG